MVRARWKYTHVSLAQVVWLAGRLERSRCGEIRRVRRGSEPENLQWSRSKGRQYVRFS